MIPKILHQIWLGPHPPPTRLFNTWKDNHPTWEYHLWTEKNMPILANQVLFDTVKKYAIKADVLRYELLYEYGGVFMDADSYCLKPIDRLLSLDFFAVQELVPPTIANGIIGVTPNHSSMKELNYLLGLLPLNKDLTWLNTGPNLFEKVARKHKCSVLPYTSFLPYTFHDIRRIKKGIPIHRNITDAYAIQLWCDTTNSYDQIDIILHTLGINGKPSV